MTVTLFQYFDDVKETEVINNTMPTIVATTSNLHLVINEDRLNQSVINSKQSIIDQSEQIKKMAEYADEGLMEALRLVSTSMGRLIVSGMGKSGHIGKKIAATMASTGTPSFFVHPAEAFHGDLGMIQPIDVVILISNSGETDEVLKLIPSLKSFGNKIIALSGNDKSTLAKNSDAVLNVKVEREICPNNLAPTSSTTAALVMGDALAIGLMHLKDFQPHDFALYHPGGSLGKRLLTKVSDVMHSKGLPFVDSVDSMQKAILTMTRSTLGVAIVLNKGELAGVITDGDLRRALAEDIDIKKRTAADMMTIIPITILQDEMLATAEEIMRENHIKHILVTTRENPHRVVGVLEYFQA